jgi:hypothetical protein
VRLHGKKATKCNKFIKSLFRIELSFTHKLYTKAFIMNESEITIWKLARKIPVQKSGLDMMAGSLFQIELLEYAFNAALPNI